MVINWSEISRLAFRKICDGDVSDAEAEVASVVRDFAEGMRRHDNFGAALKEAADKLTVRKKVRKLWSKEDNHD